MKFPILFQAVGIALSINVALSSLIYDETIGLSAMYYAGSAYCNKDDLLNWACGEPCTVHAGVSQITEVSNEAKDTFGYVAYNSKENLIIVSFRGTKGGDF
jgi:hypothetical protein